MKPQVWSICSDLKTHELLWTCNDGSEPIPSYRVAALKREERKRKMN